MSTAPCECIRLFDGWGSRRLFFLSSLQYMNSVMREQGTISASTSKCFGSK
jgi:hypothetical protein